MKILRRPNAALLLALTILTLASSYVAPQSILQNPMIELPEIGKKGFIDIQGKGYYFYWMFYSRNNMDTSPVVIWLGGGPTHSTLSEIFLGNGPYTITEDKIGVNPYAWNRFANVVYIDAPIGSGLSGKDDMYRDLNLVEEAQNMDEVLRKWFMHYQEFAGRPWYIAGSGMTGQLALMTLDKILTSDHVWMPNFKGIL